LWKALLLASFFFYTRHVDLSWNGSVGMYHVKMYVLIFWNVSNMYFKIKIAYAPSSQNTAPPTVLLFFCTLQVKNYQDFIIILDRIYCAFLFAHIHVSGPFFMHGTEQIKGKAPNSIRSRVPNHGGAARLPLKRRSHHMVEQYSTKEMLVRFLGEQVWATSHFTELASCRPVQCISTTHHVAYYADSIVLPPFRNIRCFGFVKWVYLDIF
jgi:hypothetical protein